MSELTNAAAVLRIESDEVVRLAHDLAALLNVSVVEAVAGALRDELRRELEVRARTERILALGREIREHLVEPLTHDSINEMLYGPDGLPG